jgi:hypothetical protein
MATVTDTAARERWEKENAAAPARQQPPTTVSGVPIEPLYIPGNLGGGNAVAMVVETDERP